MEALLVRHDLADEQRADTLSFLGDTFDSLDRQDDAFAAYNARKAILVRDRTVGLPDGALERDVKVVRRLRSWFASAPAAPGAVAPAMTRSVWARAGGHVFLLGFPRSGTTLLEQVLASHPKIVALEERGILAEAGDDLLLDAEAIDRLANLTPEEADIRREAYWRSVSESFDEGVSDKIFVDKAPLYTVRLPLIAKLFPDAKIIFAIRDPRDVVLSCFRRLYLSPMLEFLTLEGTADSLRRGHGGLAARLQDVLPLDLHMVRHESLVADFDGEVGKILNFIGAEWDQSVRNFAARAANAATPSASQLVRGLNAEGIGQWRRYAKNIAPVLPRLEPWVKAYGYPATEPELMPAPADPRLPDALTRVTAAAQSANWPTAFAEAERALAEGLEHPLFYRLRGVQRQQVDRLEEAIADFEIALKDNPGDFATLNALGLCLTRAGRPSEGLERLDMSIAIGPSFAPAHYNRGWTLETMADLAGARAAYREATRLDPTHAQAFASLASIAERVGNHREARDLAQRTLALDPQQPIGQTALAGVQAAMGDLGGAETRLRAVTQPGTRANPHERAVALGMLGDVLDQLSRPGDAFAAYEASNAGFSAVHAKAWAAPETETSLGLSRRLATQFARARPEAWRRPAPCPRLDDPEGHVFLLSFPRSGATMLGQALATHPGVVTLEERDTLGDVVQAFLRRPEDLDRLAALPPDEADRFRDLYWGRVRAIGAKPRGKVVVDKQPMNTVALPVIIKLFPKAKVLFLKRDPRDVVLSCFRRRFSVNATTVEFLDSKLALRCASHDPVMTLMDLYRGVLELDLRDQSYEALVADFEGEDARDL